MTSLLKHQIRIEEVLIEVYPRFPLQVLTALGHEPKWWQGKSYLAFSISPQVNEPNKVIACLFKASFHPFKK